MERMKFETPDMVAGNVEKIGAMFPNCITEAVDEEKSTKEKTVYKKAINFELLRQMLSRDVVEGDEAYEFTWVGKKAAIVEANKPIRATLRPCPEESVNWDTTENLYIEGDNLQVLKLLQESYLGKVKMIYIDPPYNTGNDFIYRDNFDKDSEEYKQEQGLYDEDDNRLFHNTDSNGRFHSDWCSMMYARFLVARNIMSKDGFMCVNIGEKEQHSMKGILLELFGEDNVDEIVWQKQGNDNKSIFSGANTIRNDHDIIYIAYKNRSGVVLNRPSEEAIFKNNYGNADNDPRGDWMSAELGKSDARSIPNGKNFYTLTSPTGNAWTRQWHFSKKEIEELDKDGRIYWGDGTTVPRLKKFLSDPVKKVPSSLFLDKGSTKVGKKDIVDLFGTEVFEYPKPVTLLKYLVDLVNDKQCVVLDFFSGSSTTAQAVMQLNAEDGGHRKFIMVQLPEKCDESSEAYKAGYKTICDIGKERIRRAGKKIKDENPLTTQDLDVGFRVLKLDSSNMKDVYYAPGEISQDLLASLESNIKEDRTDLDLLFGCVTDWALPLSLPYTSEQIDGCTMHTYNDGDQIACFNENIPDSVIREIARRKPLRAVFRDASFADSPAKINVFEIFKLLAPDASVRVI